MADDELKDLLAGLFSELPVEKVLDEEDVAPESPDSLAKLQRHALYLRTASQISSVASSVLDLGELLPQAVDLVRDEFGFYYVGIFLVDEAMDWAVLQAGTGDAGRQMVADGHRLRVGDDSMVGWCVAHRQARIALDVGQEAVRFDNPLLPDTRSEMALPLVSRGHVIGAMTIQSTAPNAFSQEDVTILQTMADQLANAVENARLLQERQRRVTEWAIVSEIGRAAASAPGLEDLLETVHERVSRLSDTTNFYVASYAEGSDEWTLLLDIEHGERLPPATHKLGAGLTGHIIRNRRPLLLRNRKASADFHNAEGIAVLGEPAKSWMGVPLIAADEVVGVMAIQSYERENVYDEQDLSLFSTIAAQVASALDSLRLIEETRRRAAEFEILHQVSLELTQKQQDLGRVLETITERVMDQLESDGGGVWLWREEDQELELVLTYQVGDVDFTGRRLKSGEGLTGRAFAEGQIQVVDHYPTWNRQSATFEDAPFVSGMAVPMIWQTEIVGALVVTRSEADHPYTDADKGLGELLAAQAAAVIQNARLFEETQRRLEELTMLSSVSQTLASAPLQPEEIADVIVHQFVEVMGVREASVSLPDPQQKDMMRVIVDLYVDDGELWHRDAAQEAFHLSEYPATARAMAERQSFVVQLSDPDADPAEAAYMRKYGTRTLAVIPMIVKGEAIGIIELETREEERRFSPTELDLAMTLANQAGVALENARLFEEVQAHARREQILREITARVRGSIDPDTIMRAAVREVGTALGRPAFIQIGEPGQRERTSSGAADGGNGSGSSEATAQTQDQAIEGGE